MLMYMFHIAFAVGLMALIMGLNMCCCGKGSCDSHGKCGKFCGWIIVILAVISLLCTMHSGYQHYMDKKFDVEMMIDMDMDGNGNGNGTK